MSLPVVAPHAGSVDRNSVVARFLTVSAVAPHAGSVDRNIYQELRNIINRGSLPTRGAWIEIDYGAEGKDNNPCRSPRGERG